MNEIENKYPAIFATPIGGLNYTINISQVFGDAYTFDEAIHILSVASPEDNIIININSDGGNLYSLVAFRNAVRATQAQVHMNLLGMAASAGGALFLEPAHTYTVHDDSCLMIHNMLCDTGYDDTHKIVTRAEHNKKLNDRFVRNTYKDFLTEKEIESVLDGKEIYLEDFEIRERLSKREEMKAEKAAQDIQTALETPIDLSEYSLEELEEELGLMTADLRDLKSEINKRKKLRDIPPYNPEPLREVVETTVKKRKTNKEKQSATDASTVY